MQRPFGIALIAVTGLLLSACGSSTTGAIDAESAGEGSAQSAEVAEPSSDDGGSGAEDRVWDALRTFCGKGERFTSLKVVELRDVGRSATNLLRIVAPVESAGGFVDPLKNVVRYSAWVDDVQTKMLSEDGLAALLDGQDTGTAMRDLADLQRQNNEIADLAMHERVTAQVRGESPPMTAASIETDFVVECSLVP